MDIKKLIPVLDRYFQTDRCLGRVSDIWASDRWNDFERYKQTAAYCANVMKEAGLEEIELLPVKADGKTFYHDWRQPRAWTVCHGSLRYADGERISDYSQDPCCLSMYSASTAGPVEAEVVDVCGLTALPSDGSLAGKVLLSDLAPSVIQPEAVKVGAAGILSCSVRLYPGIRDSREEIYDTYLWECMNQPAPDHPLFGFKLTPRQADAMHERLRQGSVHIVADVKTKSYDGISYAVSGLLRGREPQLPEVFVYGHLYEPGANDNASGSGAILEIAQCLQDAIAAGALPQPRRSIRFAMGAECAGSMAYTACHPDRAMLCGGAFDMIGTERIDRARLSLRYNPLANLSFADGALDLAVRLLEEYNGTRYAFKRHPFKVSFGTDNIIADPCFHTPTVGLVAAPATSYHSSMDTPDRIEPDILKRNALLMAFYLFGLADADADTCRCLEQELRRQTEAELETTQNPLKRCQIQEGLERALHSLCLICPELPFEPVQEQVPPMPLSAKKMGSLVPVRKVFGPLTLESRSAAKGSPWPVAWNSEWNIPLFWADGSRTLWEIAVQTALELDTVTEEAIEKKYMQLQDYFQFLESYGYISWK